MEVEKEEHGPTTLENMFGPIDLLPSMRKNGEVGHSKLLIKM